MNNILTDYLKSWTDKNIYINHKLKIWYIKCRRRKETHKGGKTLKNKKKKKKKKNKKKINK